ncbi:MAG: SGNH/GDSL hydrolase family protein [Anaerolineaceae bacterium]|nr:SGNH/GDSL hydrolase family protein [Anaerolineaceae bacterium]
MTIQQHPFRLLWVILLFLLLVFSACSNKSQNEELGLSTSSGNSQIQNTVKPSEEDNPSNTNNAQSENTATINEPEPTDTNEDNEGISNEETQSKIEEFTLHTREIPPDFNWKEQPIIPEISQNALEILRYGLQSGREITHISVIGDCQAIPFVFLGKYGLRQYSLDPVDLRLEKMIAFYRNSFKREGNAVRGGFTAAAVLAPVRADPDNCMLGESPLDCEWRVHNPSITFINLETWREEGTVDRYELYLEKIVEYALERGILPIIIMKADKAESETHVINPAMARVAYKYDIPLVNFWRSAQYLDNYGIDSTREGFHLSEEGYDLKQILALRTLYKLWNTEVSTENDVESPEEEIESTKEIPLEDEPILDEEVDFPFPEFSCQSNCLYFDRFTASPQGVYSEGIFELNLDSNELKKITTEGIALQDVSTSQNLFLLNQDTDLFLLNRENQEIIHLMENLYINGGSSAYFSQNDETVTAISTDENGQSIVRITLENRIQEIVISNDYSPIQLITYSPENAIYWKSGTCESQDFCQINSYWQYQIGEEAPSEIVEKENIVFSTDGAGIAFRDPQYADKTNYFHNPILLYEDVETGITSRRLFTFSHPGGFMVHPVVQKYSFSPDGSKIFVLNNAYSDYFEKSVALHFYIEDLEMRMVFEHGQLDGAFGSFNPQIVWSPDNDEVLLLMINTNNDRDYTFEIYQKDVINRFSDILTVIEPFEQDGYSYLHQAFWVKEATP